MRFPLLLLPGWGIPADAYPGLGHGQAVDYGFFGKAPAFPLADPLSGLRHWLPPAGDVLALIGHSLGAMLALQAATMLPPPQRIRALILVSGFARFTEDGAGWPGQPAAAVGAMIGRLGTDAPSVLRSFHRRAADPERQALAMPRSPRPDVLASGLAALRDADLRPALAKVATPTLLLHGSADRIVPLAQAQRLAAMLPNARLMDIPDAGHLLPLTRGEACRHAITEFLHGLP